MRSYVLGETCFIFSLGKYLFCRFLTDMAVMGSKKVRVLVRPLFQIALNLPNNCIRENSVTVFFSLSLSDQEQFFLKVKVFQLDSYHFRDAYSRCIQQGNKQMMLGVLGYSQNL